MAVTRTLETLFDLRKPAVKTNKVLVVGVSSKRSLGLAIGEHMYQNGWETVLTSRRPEKLSAKTPHHDIRFLDYPQSIDAIDDLTDLTGMVFCLAKTDIGEAGQNGLLGTSEENFLKTISTSCYAFIALVREVQRAAGLPTDDQRLNAHRNRLEWGTTQPQARLGHGLPRLPDGVRSPGTRQQQDEETP